jgi:hypothetical protein
MFEIIGKFIFKLFTPNRRTTSTVSEWISSLYHEFGYDAMEYNAFEVSATCMTDEVLDSLGCLLREQSHMYITKGGMNRCGIRQRRWTGSARSWRGGSNVLLLTGRSLVEDITIIRFVVP